MSRKHPRIRTRLTATVHMPETQASFVCPTRDISHSGCFLETSADVVLGTQLSVAIMDVARGEVLELEGEVARRTGQSDSSGREGLGIRFAAPPDGWIVMVDRLLADDGFKTEHSGIRLRVLVVGDDDHRRGALALYVTSGWDVRFASNLDTALEALEGVPISACIAEHDLADERWTEILTACRRLQPQARRIVRCALGGNAAPQTDPSSDLVHRVVDTDAGLDALVDALTADIGV